MRKSLLSIGKEKKVGNGDWGEETTNHELKCYLLGKAELLKLCYLGEE